MNWQRKSCDKEVYCGDDGWTVAKRTATGEYILRHKGQWIGAYPDAYTAKEEGENIAKGSTPKPKQERQKVWRDITDNFSPSEQQ